MPHSYVLFLADEYSFACIQKKILASFFPTWFSLLIPVLRAEGGLGA